MRFDDGTGGGERARLRVRAPRLRLASQAFWTSTHSTCCTRSRSSNGAFVSPGGVLGASLDAAALIPSKIASSLHGPVRAQWGTA
jgi:hypothetical protein